ncbi:ABC-2 type transport system permease protein [Anoxybacillus tepidamans]|uniref:ABC-2 type transport system permease protein n=1 Tax=Anoxybacteroides tepidamans TaxID=265948 RepID=A0A7W8ISB9_9BACL|nr:ABC transporter permease [Anoxybacillus tepidamans]MBB5325051.1 ABC-2 type transport system permease protein [Anoxybacillus tepidamans]
MIGTFVKKQLLLFVRNRHELLILLGMPFVLITILGFALGNIMDGNDGQPAVHAKIAFVNEGDEQQDIQKFTHEVEAMRMPENEKQLLIEAARSLSPITVLKQDVFGAKPLKKYIRIVDVPPAQLNKALQDDEYTAIVRLPDEFTYQMLKHLFFQQKQPTNLFFYVNEEKAWTSEIVGQIISEFQQHYSLVSALGKAGVKEFAIPDIHVNGKIETITKKEPIRAVTYYMIGMGVMFALYVASNVGSYAFEEKQSHVFDRMLLANVSKWSYMTGIFISAMLLSFLQLMILYGATSIIYGITWPDVAAFLLVTAALSFAVGGLAVLLTSLNFRTNSEQASRFFQTVLVTMFSLVGGSFFPAGQLSNFINTLGAFTPNGASMSAYLKLLQGYHLADVAYSIVYLCIFSAATMVLSVWAFPKRGNEA